MPWHWRLGPLLHWRLGPVLLGCLRPVLLGCLPPNLHWRLCPLLCGSLPPPLLGILRHHWRRYRPSGWWRGRPGHRLRQLRRLRRLRALHPRQLVPPGRQRGRTGGCRGVTASFRPALPTRGRGEGRQRRPPGRCRYSNRRGGVGGWVGCGARGEHGGWRARVCRGCGGWLKCGRRHTWRRRRGRPPRRQRRRRRRQGRRGGRRRRLLLLQGRHGGGRRGR